MAQGDAPLLGLLSRLPRKDGEPDREALLDLFLAYVDQLGITLYPAQEEAILELLEWKHVILGTPTGSGKSLVATALHFQALAEGRASYYTCPIKALVNEKFFGLCDAFGPENVGLVTGDGAVNRNAPIVCCTAEILANMALDASRPAVDYVVMDEFHYYGDPERGAAWQIPLVSMREAVFLLMSATLGDTSHIARRLHDYTEREVATIAHGERPVPLAFEYKEAALQETVESLVAAGEAPVYVVNFTQRAASEQAESLKSINVCTKEEKQEIGRRLQGRRFETPYGKELRRLLGHGIGVHHAGLLPRYRLTVEQLAQAGLLKVVSGTDSLGVGVNIPIRTVVFTGLAKFDGEKSRLLEAREFHQIAGRAGRKGFDDHGRVVVQAPEHVVENKRLEAKLAKNPHLRNKLKKKQPPARGWVHYDESTFRRLLAAPPEPLEPRFEVTHGMLIRALESPGDRPGGGYRRLVGIIGRAHLLPGQRRYQLRRAASLFKSLRLAEIAEIVPAAAGRGASFRVRSDLQADFSLNQTLSLFLVEAVGLLDPASATFARDVLSAVEAVLEDPTPILIKQKDRIKDELMARMRAEGASYEERMEALEKVEHAKPLAELLYEAFGAFARFHPWVGGESIRPKSVARDIYEQGSSFADYIRLLGAPRSEGVLLRYLSQVYKTCVQTVPEPCWNEELEDIQAFLLTLLQMTDSSLLEEWERLMDGGPLPIRGRSADGPRPDRAAELARDPRRLAARVRSEMHMLLRSLCDRNFEGAGGLVRQTEEHAWSEARFAEALAPYFAEHRAIDVTPRARQPIHTVLTEVAPRMFEVAQKILSPEGDDTWALFGAVDLTRPWDEESPLVELLRIGT